MALIIVLLSINIASAMTGEQNFIGRMPNGFERERAPEVFEVKTEHSHILPSGTIIPKDATLFFDFLKAQKERRWHKGGYIICKLKGYEKDKKYVDLFKENLYIRILKYEPVIPKDAIILGTEIVLMQGASFFAPGSDIGYYFIKGAIVREFHKNWFKAGVLHAYNYSVIWFWFHGKPIELEENGLLEAKYIDDLKADSLIYLSQKYDAKAGYKKDKKELKSKLKATKKEYKKDYKELKTKYKNKEITQDEIIAFKGEFKTSYKKQKQSAKETKKQSKTKCKTIRHELKMAHNITHDKLKQEKKIKKKELKIQKKHLDKSTKKELKTQKKQIRKELKSEVKELKHSYIEAIKQERRENRLKRKEERIKRKQERKEIKTRKREEKRRLKLEKKEFKKSKKNKNFKNM